MLKATSGMQEVAFNIPSYLGNMPMSALVYVNYSMCGTCHGRHWAASPLD